jgi:uncharacterized membrane protein HdeD (DUF308 family)
MERDWMNLSWQSLVVRGAVGVVFGIIAMVWPVSTAIALAVLWGIWALVDGVGSIVQAFQPQATGRVLLVVMGLIALVAGFFAIFSPAVAAVTLTWILGIWLMVRGVFELVGAFTSTESAPRWLLALGGGLSIVLGVLFVVNPGRSAVAIAFWLGLTALAWGLAFVVLGIVLRSQAHGAHRRSTPPATPPPATA